MLELVPAAFSLLSRLSSPRNDDWRPALCCRMSIGLACMGGCSAFFYGKELGDRLVAAEWYVQRQVMPRCPDDVGIVLNSITADITAHLVVEGPPE